MDSPLVSTLIHEAYKTALAKSKMPPTECKVGSDYFNLMVREVLVQLVVEKCIYIIQSKIVRNGDTPENLRSLEHLADIRQEFGIKL